MECHQSKRALPNTPRISDRIKEYYLKFGQDRDLEKFMRIYSPIGGGSQDSHGTHSSGKTSLGECMMMMRPSGSRETLCSMPTHHQPLNSGGGCCGVNSKSMPNIDMQGKGAGAIDFRDQILDINIELEEVGGGGKVLSASTECIQTPIKDPLAQAKQSRTPESVAKSHRRLEWDSLGDIGYKKSMSTSNISVLERSLLKEFFKENSYNSETLSIQQSGENKSKTGSKEQLKNIKLIQTLCTTEQATPPLASSTLVEPISNKSNNQGGARPKMISQWTSSTSLQKKFEKYAQTSLIKPTEKQSQEVQVSMSSSATSVIDESITPSSFEYRSSRRSSRSSKSSEYKMESLNSKPQELSSQQHPFITSISELLAKRKHLSENQSLSQSKVQQMEHMRKLQTQFQSALAENKENNSYTQNTMSSASTSSFSLTRQAPELDLGIQLICSLIDAKSLNSKQKRKLIRDIVRRITSLNDDSNDLAETSNYNGKNGGKPEEQDIYDSVHSSGRNALEKSCEALLHLKCDLGVKPLSYDNLKNRDKSNVKTNSRKNSAKSLNEIKNVLQTNNSCKNIRQHQNSQTGSMKGHDSHNSNASQNSQPPSKITIENGIEVLNLTGVKKSQEKCTKQATNKLEDTEKRLTGGGGGGYTNTPNNYTQSTQTTKTCCCTESKKSRKLPLSMATSSDTNTASATSTTSSSSSHDLPTQKSLQKPPQDLNKNTADNDQATMREWLNPLTQSEIEYEEKKREESELKKKLLDNEKSKKKSDCEILHHLGWIDNEIKRLECLKHLLTNKDDPKEKSTTLYPTSLENSKSNQDTTTENVKPEKQYDTVYSDTSSVLSRSAERLVRKIEYILEDSDFAADLKENSKKRKERKEEIKIVYENPIKNNRISRKYTSVKETVKINKEKTTASTFPPTQRKKIATPTDSETSPKATESIRDLVKQKKRDFMESYKTKKQHHYDALKQHQGKAYYKYVPTEISQPTAFKYSGHYSVPHTINRNFSPTEYAYPQSRLPPTPEDNEKTNKTSSAIVYSSTATKFNQPKSQHIDSPPSTSSAATASSASMFIVSSDVSVPMGSNNVSSTPTTTHHYDDVAAAVAGVAVQTSESILRTICPQLQPYLNEKPQHTQTSSSFPKSVITTTAAIQVKPRGIAYCIEFGNEKMNNKKIANTESASNIALRSSVSPTNVVSSVIKSTSEPQMTLQDHLEKARPQFLQHSKERKAILNQMQALRQARDMQLREIIENTSLNSLDRRLNYLPPPPTQKLRILNTKEMKALTNKRFASLPEVVAREQRELEEKKRRGNRVLRDVFNRRLQRRVRNGKLSLNHSRTVI